MKEGAMAVTFKQRYVVNSNTSNHEMCFQFTATIIIVLYFLAGNENIQTQKFLQAHE